MSLGRSMELSQIRLLSLAYLVELTSEDSRTLPLGPVLRPVLKPPRPTFFPLFLDLDVRR